MLVRISRICTLAMLCAAAAVATANADPVVIYSNFGPAPGYVEHDWGAQPFAPGPFYQQSDQSSHAMGFQLGQDAVLTAISFPVVWDSVLPNGITATIFPTDDEGVPFFTCAIACLEIDVPADATPFTASMLTLDVAARPTLSAGATYFLLAHARGPGFDTINWPWNNSGREGVVADLFLGPTFSTGRLAAFQLEGEPAPVPEPASILLLATGLSAIATRARRR